MEPPEWLNGEFLSAALEVDHGRVTVLGFVCTPAVKEGNNYFSLLFRVTVKFKKEGDCEAINSVSLIVKAPVTDEFMKTLADRMQVVKKELLVYNELMPEIHRNIEDGTLTPRNFHSARDDVLVLEDLNENGYTMCDRIEQLDHDHCVNVMRTLAKFHAFSVALHEKNPELIEEVGSNSVYIENIEPDQYEKYSAIVEKSLTCTARAVKTFRGYEHFGEKILRQSDTMWDRMVTISVMQRHVKVLNHGDPWTNNILFKHDESGKVTDVKLIDFQLCKYATPGVDIQTFLVSSANAVVRKNGYSDLINAYRETFNATLGKLNCNVRLSAEELEEEVRFADALGFFITCSLVPIIMADPENPPKLSENKGVWLDSLDPNVNPYVKIYYGDCFKDVLINQLEMLEARGFF